MDFCCLSTVQFTEVMVVNRRNEVMKARQNLLFCNAIRRAIFLDEVRVPNSHLHFIHEGITGMILSPRNSKLNYYS